MMLSGFLLVQEKESGAARRETHGCPPQGGAGLSEEREKDKGIPGDSGSTLPHGLCQSKLPYLSLTEQSEAQSGQAARRWLELLQSMSGNQDSHRSLGLGWEAV